MPTFVFNGPDKAIEVTFGAGELNVTTDLLEEIYEPWKIWFNSSDNSKFGPAFGFSGGEPADDVESLGITLFLETGWCIVPFIANAGNYKWRLVGNLFTRDPSSDLVCTDAIDITANLFFNQRTSTLPTTTTVTVAGSNVITGDIADVPAAVQTGMSAQGYSAALATKMDQIQFTIPGYMDVNTLYMNDTEIIGIGRTGDGFRGIGEPA